MSMNIGSTIEEQKRIDTLIDFMGKYINSDIVWRLKRAGFFVAPASIRYHGAYEGALFDHSYGVDMKLTLEEIFCIRWHMGAFDSKENWNSYGAACTEYPNVLYTHTADMIAARIIGV